MKSWSSHCAKREVRQGTKTSVNTDNERSFIGTWTTDEVNTAIEKGYKVLRTYEEWHSDKTTYDLFKVISKDSLKSSLSLVSTILKQKRKRQISRTK